MSIAYISIDLRDIDSDDLLQELEDRAGWMDDHEEERLLKMMSGTKSDKVKLFMKIMDRYSLFELEQMFQEKADAAAGKNQLALPL